MSNLCTRVLRILTDLRHPATLADLQPHFPALKRPGDLDHAIQGLKRAKLLAWTPDGWEPSPLGRRLIANGARIRVDRKAA